MAASDLHALQTYGRQRSSHTSDSALITAGAPRRRLPLCYFSYPHPISSRRPPEREWGRPALSSSPGHLSNSENDVSDCQGIAATIASAASHVLKSSFFISKEDRLFIHLADFFKSLPFSWPKRHGPERVSWDSVASHSPLRWPYRQRKPLWWDFSDPPQPPSFLLLSLQKKHFYLHSRQGLVMVDLLDNFLNPLKLFMTLASNLMKWPWRRTGGEGEKDKRQAQLRQIRWEMSGKTWSKSIRK